MIQTKIKDLDEQKDDIAEMLELLKQLAARDRIFVKGVMTGMQQKNETKPDLVSFEHDDPA